MPSSLKPVLGSTQSVRPLRLNSERLAVEIAYPGLLYAGPRFDWSAFITQVTLDGRHAFCTPESIDGSGSGGVGLCSEFGIQSVQGYDEARVGEQFVKPGVGLLTKLDEAPYSFMKCYPIEPFVCRVEIRDDFVRFVTEPRDCRGIALRTEKTVRITGNHLDVDCRMENCGSQRLVTEEYCHNFVALNGRGVDPQTTLCWSRHAEPTKALGAMRCDSQSVTWPVTPTETFYGAFTLKPSEFRDASHSHAHEDFWELRHAPSGLWMRESTSVPWSRMAVFGTSRLVSPEAFIDIDLQPGAVKSWTRHFEFHAPAKMGNC